MRRPRIGLRLPRTVTAIAAAALLAGCGLNLESVALPAPGGGGSFYTLNAVFSDALNLPTKAKVRLYGAQIGEVSEIRAQDFTAHIAMHVRSDVPLYEGSTAELRAATPLGDVFVQIRPDPNRGEDAELLRDGATLPLEATANAPTIEELLGSMALLVNGGTVRYLVSMLNGAGDAVGGRGSKVATLIEQTDTLLSRMSARSEQLDASLRNSADLAAAMSQRQSTFDEALTGLAPALNVISANTEALVDLINTGARITAQLARFPSLRGTDTRSISQDVNTLARVLNEITVDPELSLTPFNRFLGILMKTFNGTAAHLNGEIAQLTLAPWPDMNYPGDPGFHWSDGTDWHLMIGALRYEWNMLLSHIYGPQR
ncbi:MCE family protein [Mycolicibacillus parakoreensis]|uniref:MlaD family protein n=1 Tax=Mycolicibacillus parakoreensis TaxID=1069221 RepID=A0ABY3TW05_9MYCO|nr:MlaD family protein [Mycolicibacillus parakoreensis]MCV7315669.1 MCE family protein [Mycolicibacillus parakoreensis]ULN51892.1 MlaD family protein [Mycolicibacillus parakoreensis]